jgi:predicted Zn-dependent protease with MMP-like domain
MVKNNLNVVYASPVGYAVVFSGKKSNSVNGLYKPDSKEIIINDRNFNDDNLLIYTAIHELAHHICMTERNMRNGKAHTQIFWSVFHDLLDSAISKNIYVRGMNASLQSLVKQAQEIDRQIARLQRTLGGVLLEIHKQCADANVRYDDVIDNEVRLSRKTRNAAVKSAQCSVPDAYGQDVQNIIIQANNDDTRSFIFGQAENNKSIDQIKTNVSRAAPNKNNNIHALTIEKNRVQKTIYTLQLRLNAIIEEINKRNNEHSYMHEAADTPVPRQNKEYNS